MRRIGVLMNIGADDPQAVLVGAFSQGLAESGWIIGRNARIDYRWYQGAEVARAYAAELLALTPDIILAAATPGTMAVKQLTRTVPIVFTRVAHATKRRRKLSASRFSSPPAPRVLQPQQQSTNLSCSEPFAEESDTKYGGNDEAHLRDWNKNACRSVH